MLREEERELAALREADDALDAADRVDVLDELAHRRVLRLLRGAEGEVLARGGAVATLLAADERVPAVRGEDAVRDRGAVLCVLDRLEPSRLLRRVVRLERQEAVEALDQLAALLREDLLEVGGRDRRDLGRLAVTVKVEDSVRLLWH